MTEAMVLKSLSASGWFEFSEYKVDLIMPNSNHFRSVETVINETGKACGMCLK